MGKTISLEITGSSNVGLFGYATDTYCLVGKALTEETVESFKKALDVPTHDITIAGSQQIGAYLSGNSKMLLVPSILTAKEKEALEELQIPFTIIETKHTALGNNLIVGENYFFYTPEMEKSAVQEIKDALKLEGEELELKDWDVVGSIIVLNSHGGLIQKDVDEDIKKHIEEKLQLPLEQGTVNFGSHVIGGGIVVNKNGMVIGKASAGIEITNADMAFGFLEK